MADVNSTLYCIHCGSEITRRINKTTGLPSKAPRKYCGRRCLESAAEARRPPRADRKGREVEGFCPGCGRHFLRYSRSGDDAGKYCSRECYFSLRSRVSRERDSLRRIAATARRRAALRSKPSRSKLDLEMASIRRIGINAAPSRITVRPCSRCGAKTIGTKNYSRTCDDCKRQARREWSRSSPSRRRHKRIYRAKRRAIERGAKAHRIDPIRVFERDKWRCHLCGCRTPKRLRGSYEPNAPELDHIIPLAAGGSHTWGNVACSCRQCNIAKSDQPMGQIGLELSM